MGELFPFLTRIFDFLVMWIPHFVIVNRTRGGVKWVRGSDVKPVLCDNGMWWPRWIFIPGILRPWRWHQWDNWWRITGLHWYWPFVTHEPTLAALPEQTTRFRKQILTTKDGKTIYVKGVLRYEIEDPVALLTQCYDYDDTAEDVSAVAIASVVSENTLGELLSETKKTATALSGRVRGELKRFGIRVIRLSLSDFATGRPHVHMTDFDSRQVTEEE